VCEQSIIDVVLVVLFGRMFEVQWGSTELLVFFCTVGVCTGLVSLCVLGVVCAVAAVAGGGGAGDGMAGEHGLWFEADVCGLTGVLSGFLVAVAQTNPGQEYPVGLLGVTLRARQFPFLAVCVSAVVGVFVGFQSLLLCVAGVVSGWAYLRFFQRRPGSGSGSGSSRGDRSDGFSFGVLLPDVVRPVFDWLARQVSRVWSSLALALPHSSGSVTMTTMRGVGGSGGGDVESGVGGSGSIDAEAAARRRTIALHAIDQRLQELDRQQATQQQQQQQQQQPPSTTLPPKHESQATTTTTTIDQ
jgi:hypothetical protein